ncbi:MAG: hypothetical protein IPN95_12935 [Bacteroidetes bacterium]|nr:hypothetical protein [Bacteroidota bacterium]
MLKNKSHLINSYWFLTGLFLLLVNDFVLKAHFGNWFTGKLSDFAGLFIFPIFFTALFPRQKKAIFVLTAILFAIWKSSLSQPFIDTWNANAWITIDRVVDPSDLLGLLALPLAFLLESRRDKLKHLRIQPILPFCFRRLLCRDLVFDRSANRHFPYVSVAKGFTRAALNQPKAYNHDKDQTLHLQTKTPLRCAFAMTYVLMGF